MKLSLKKCQPSTQDCPECEGAGVTQDVDYDEDGAVYVTVKCEACDGQGHLVDCRDCDEPISPIVAEINSGFCGACLVRREMGDASSERERIRRTA